MIHARKMLGRAVFAAVLLASCAAADAKSVLRFVPRADLQTLDPMGSTADILKIHGFLVYDTLFALDEKFQPQPQMVKEMTRSADGRIYRLALRDGLKWHDGQAVTAEDCVASLNRWMMRDAAGQLMKRQMKEMRVVDAGAFEIEFNAPYPLLVESLSKLAANIPFMMPKRIAETDAFKEIPEPIGSGPYRFVASEWIPGNKVVYEKFDGYAPRKEPASGFAGGKVANLDRIEWIVMRDQQTALSALIAGEVDFWDNPSMDLLPVVEAAGLKTATINETGYQGQLYFNHLQPPFDNAKARQAMFWLTRQDDYMQAVSGNPKFFRSCASFFPCGTPMETDAGLDALKRPDPEKAKALFREAGWDFSRPIVVLDPTDESIAHPETVVTVQALRSIGLTVDVQPMDWATMLKRRNSKDAPDKGGWNLLHSYTGGQVVTTPVWSIAFSAACEKGLFGWPCDQALEDMRLKWALADGVEAKRAVAAEYSRRAFETGHHVPLGQWTTYVAYSSKVSGILKTQDVPVFWNARKAD